MFAYRVGYGAARKRVAPADVIGGGGQFPLVYLLPVAWVIALSAFTWPAPYQEFWPDPPWQVWTLPSSSADEREVARPGSVARAGLRVGRLLEDTTAHRAAATASRSG